MKNEISLQSKDGKPYEVPEEGSLGLLALGYVGLMLWREKRRQLKTHSFSSSNNEHTE